MRTATVVRAACTQRLHTQYSVIQCLRSKLVKRAVEHARRLIDQAQAQAQAQALSAAAGAAVKGIMYCRSRQLYKQLAHRLACSAYHAGSTSRSEILQEWRQHRGLIISTSALGVGIDIPCIRFTLHIEQA
jgi:superfamily II DNA helicase RecQ